MYAFITVRTRSSRLHKKCLLPFGEGNVLKHVIRRAKNYGFEPVVCTTLSKEDDAIEAIAHFEGCRVYRGNSIDVLGRWMGACVKFDIDSFHYIGADDVFFDGKLGQESLQMLKQGFLDIIYPPENAYIGACAHSLTREIVRGACCIEDRDARRKRRLFIDTETFWPYIERVPGVRGATLLVPDARTAKMRLTLDYIEDYWMLLTVLRILGPNATREEIEDLFLRNPELHLVNWFRNEQWKEKQEAKEKEIRAR